MTTRKAQQGVSLIEVLVAAVIIAIGLMGVAGMQTRSLQMNQSAHLRSQANYYAYEAVDAMRMNRQAARNGDFNIGMGDAPPSGNSVPEQFLDRWVDGIETTLPMTGNDNAGGSINVNENGDTTEVTVAVAWLDERWEEGATEDEKIRTITLETEL